MLCEVRSHSHLLVLSTSDCHALRWVILLSLAIRLASPVHALTEEVSKQTFSAACRAAQTGIRIEWSTVACLAPVGDILKTRTQQTKNKTRRFFFFLSLYTLRPTHQPHPLFIVRAQLVAKSNNNNQTVKTVQSGREIFIIPSLAFLPPKKQEQQERKRKTTATEPTPTTLYIVDQIVHCLTLCVKLNY